MARKYEFKPDKTDPGLLHQLYLTKKQRLSTLKWGLYALALLALSVLQDVVLSRYRIYGATTELVPCAIFLISILQGLERGCVFALVASLMYLFSGTAAGPYSIVFITFLAVGATYLRQNYLQKGFFAALLCAGGAMVLYELGIFCIGAFLQLTRPDRLVGFALTAGLTIISVPILYPIFLAIGKIGGETWKE